MVTQRLKESPTSELVHIHRQAHSKALGTIIYKSHNIENTNLSSIFLSTLLLASIHINYVGFNAIILLPTSKNLSNILN